MKIYNSTHTQPLRAAWWAQVLPALSAALMSAPCWRSAWITFKGAECNAKCRGVSPKLLQAFTSAPKRSNISTNSKLPLVAARCSGVIPCHEGELTQLASFSKTLFTTAIWSKEMASWRAMTSRHVEFCVYRFGSSRTQAAGAGRRRVGVSGYGSLRAASRLIFLGKKGKIYYLFSLPPPPKKWAGSQAKIEGEGVHINRGGWIISLETHLL